MTNLKVETKSTLAGLDTYRSVCSQYFKSSYKVAKKYRCYFPIEKSEIEIFLCTVIKNHSKIYRKTHEYQKEHL